jgi:hypothetical protein
MTQDNLKRELVDFETAHVAIGTVKGFILTVSGETPRPMEVKLEPVPFDERPEWWKIEVAGYSPDFGPEVVTPYQAHFGFDSVQGTKGIELIGKTKTERL